MAEFFPRGRLTLVSGSPVQAADVTGATSVYYTPYIDNIVPIWNGTSFVNKTFAQLTAALDTTKQVHDQLYDLFVFLNENTVAIGFGPAWLSGTGGSNQARGSGANSTELSQIEGLWVNTNSISLNNGATTFNGIPASKATYLGTIATTSVNGQTAMQFKPTPAAGGTNTWLGLWNAYNRVVMVGQSQDTNGWTASSSSWRPLANSSANRITWVDGLAQSRFAASLYATVQLGTNTAYQQGVAFDSVSSVPAGKIGYARSENTTSAHWHDTVGSDQMVGLGLHYAQGMESSPNNNTSILSASPYNLLTASIEM